MPVLPAFVVDRDLQRAKEFLILRRKFDLPTDFAARGLGLGAELDGFTFVAVFGILALVESDGGLKNQEDVVPRAFNLANCGSDAIRVGKRFVDRVSKFL